MNESRIRTVCCNLACDMLPELEALLEGALMLFEAGESEKSAALVYMAVDKLRKQNSAA